MYKCGIIYVEDIYNFVEKTFMTYEQARYEYGAIRTLKLTEKHC